MVTVRRFPSLLTPKVVGDSASWADTAVLTVIHSRSESGAAVESVSSLLGSPVITSGPTLVDRTETTIKLTWTADQYVQSWLRWGPTSSLGNETGHENSFNYATHIQEVQGLTAGTTYYFQVVVVNAAGQQTVGSIVTFATSPTAPPPPPPDGIVYTDYSPPAGITTISALQSWLNSSVPNGTDATHRSRILLGAGRTYSGASGLNFTGRRFLTFEGGGSPVSFGHTGGAIIQSTGPWGSVGSSCFYHQGTACFDIVFHCLTALGSSPSSGTGAYASATAGQGGEIAMGFALYGADNVTIDHCIMDRNKGDGVYVAAYGSHWTTNLVVRDSTIRRNGRMGFGIIASDGLVGQRIFFDDICYSPIDYEPNQSGEGARGTHLWEDCRFGTYSWDNSYGEGTIIFITGSSAATFTGSLTARRGIVVGRNMAFPTRSGTLFYLHRGAAKAWTLLLEDFNGIDAEGPAPYVVVMGGWTGATTIRNNINCVQGSPSLGSWVYDAGGNTGPRTWQTSD